MSYLNWHIGMKVVCVQGVRAKAYGSISVRGEHVGTVNNPRYPEQGEVYTVRHINAIDDDYILILLEEVRNDHLGSFIRGGLEPGFHAKYFRPVQTRATDISIFTQLLNPSKVDA